MKVGGLRSPDNQRSTPARPLGVGLLAALAAPVGLSFLSGGLSLLAGRWNGAPLAVGLSGVSLELGLAAIAMGGADIAFAFGAWTRRPWALRLGVVLCFIHIVVAVLVATGTIGTSLAVVALVASAIYLRRVSVRQTFGAVV